MGSGSGSSLPATAVQQPQMGLVAPQMGLIQPMMQPMMQPMGMPMMQPMMGTVGTVGMDPLNAFFMTQMPQVWGWFTEEVGWWGLRTGRDWRDVQNFRGCVRCRPESFLFSIEILSDPFQPKIAVEPHFFKEKQQNMYFSQTSTTTSTDVFLWTKEPVVLIVLCFFFATFFRARARCLWAWVWLQRCKVLLLNSWILWVAFAVVGA